MDFKRNAEKIACAANDFLDRTMPFTPPLGVFLGVFLNGPFLRLRAYVPLIFGFMTFSGALRLRFRELALTIKRPLPLVIFFAAAHGIMPFLVFLLSSLIFPGEPETVSGYVLLYSVPTAITGLMWTSIFRGDPALALTLILLDTFLAPLVVPASVSLFLGARVSLNMTGIAVSLILMVVVPTVAAVVLNESSGGRAPKLMSSYLNPLSKLCMVLVIAANSAAIAPQIRLEEPRTWTIMGVCIGFSVLGFTCARLWGLLIHRLRKDFSPEKQGAFFFAAALRNTSAAMTLGIDFLPPQAGLPSVLGIIFQQMIAAVMGRLLLNRRARQDRAPP
jgi:tagaturonate reductase